MNKRSLIFILLFAALCLVGYKVFFKDGKEVRQVTFFVNYNDTSTTMHTGTENTTLEEALRQAGYTLSSEAHVFPDKTSKLSSGTVVTVYPAQTFTIIDEKETHSVMKPAKTVQDALTQSGTVLHGADFVEPPLEAALSSGDMIAVTRVTVSEESEDTKIAFKKEESEDDTLSFRIKKVVQKGEPGVLAIRYKVSRHNGKVVAKEKIDEQVTKEPVNEKTVIGTKVTVIKKHNGAASWYKHTGTLSAANPWLPMGSYVRVTNKGNGKSVIVKINDRGPFGAGRIIDLDSVAFAKISDLGVGVVDVLMEEIK